MGSDYKEIAAGLAEYAAGLAEYALGNRSRDEWERGQLATQIETALRQVADDARKEEREKFKGYAVHCPTSGVFLCATVKAAEAVAALICNFASGVKFNEREMESKDSYIEFASEIIDLVKSFDGEGIREKCEEYAYSKQPTESKPQCAAGVFRGGKFRPCNRTARYGHETCFSHQKWSQEAIRKPKHTGE